MKMFKIYGRKSIREIENTWEFMGISKHGELVYYSPDHTQRFATYPNTYCDFVTDNKMIVKIWDKIFTKKH